MFTGIMRGLQVYPERMRENIERTQGVIVSQRVLLALIDKGLSRQKAYELVQRNAMRAWKERHPFREFLEADPEVSGLLPPAELDELFDYAYFTRHVDASFQRLGLI